ncbi:MAG TPA: GNAT family N-acetyltransferase [Mycobacteriales bacterium]|nr:GNAT family N-acetyltransferase [Mycobacteriales bacterium]
MTVRRATLEDAKLLGDVLADAFADDPVISWLIPHNADNRDERLRLFFTAMSRTYLRSGKPCYLSGDGMGAALWGPPGSWALDVAQMADDLDSLITAFGDRIDISTELQAQVEDLHPADPPHYYLAYLGARRSSQGHGHGSRLMAEVLATADANGVPAYLESSNARNVPLYERHGFKVVGEFQALDDGPTIWRMWRDPQH